MIKHILNLIKSWFHKEEMDPHAELYLKEKESDVPVYENEEAVKAEHCSTHKRFKKSCKLCQEIVK